jgi:hypothetical protein
MALKIAFSVFLIKFGMNKSNPSSGGTQSSFRYIKAEAKFLILTINATYILKKIFLNCLKG